MIVFLGEILATLLGIGQTILFAIETGANLLMAGLAVAAAAAFALLPGMGSAGTLGTPLYLQWLNYFLPVGGFLALLASGVTIWVAFLAVRYVLRLARAL